MHSMKNQIVNECSQNCITGVNKNLTGKVDIPEKTLCNIPSLIGSELTYEIKLLSNEEKKIH